MRGALALLGALAVAGALAGEAAAPAREADLAVELTASAPVIGAGQAVRFTTVVRNLGPDSALDVVVRQTLPPGATLVSAHASQGRCDVDGSTLRCALGLMGWGNLAHGAHATVELVVRADSTGPLETTAAVSSASLALELVPENDSAAARVAVAAYSGPRPHAELGVELFAPKTAVVGRRFSYTARITNYGPDALGALGVGGERVERLSTVPRRRGLLRISFRGATATVRVR
jgi:uncharacterized repeat protein (TIGR01451 family)